MTLPELFKQLVDRRIYCFHESEPASRPQPVALLPPKAPPISAPLVGAFKLIIPLSAPFGPLNLAQVLVSLVKIDEDRPIFEVERRYYNIQGIHLKNLTLILKCVKTGNVF